jgi:hypothetical protein
VRRSSPAFAIIFFEHLGEKIMVARKRRAFTGLLAKPIQIEDAKPRGLRIAFAAPPDETDVKAHISEEVFARCHELDKFFSLESNSRNIWEQRAKALLAYRFNILADALQSWEHLCCYLMRRYVPGFSLKRPGKKRFGAPTEWDSEQLAQLFADIEFLKKNSGKSVSEICKLLPTLTKGYTKRWGRYRGKREGLRKAYSKAKQLLDQDFRFRLYLCGGGSLIPSKRIDPIKAAIELHALQEL